MLMDEISKVTFSVWYSSSTRQIFCNVTSSLDLLIKVQYFLKDSVIPKDYGANSSNVSGQAYCSIHKI